MIGLQDSADSCTLGWQPTSGPESSLAGNLREADLSTITFDILRDASFGAQSDAMFPRRFLAPILTVVCLCTALIGQSQQSESENSRAESPFVIVPSAKNIVRHELAGRRQQVSYDVDAEYPAQSIIDRIKRDLKTRGWTPMTQDYFNPGQPNSIVRGWEYYEDHATQPNTSVRYWQADWRRQREIVTYRLEYRCPENECASTRDLRDLQVIAVHAADANKTYR